MIGLFLAIGGALKVTTIPVPAIFFVIFGGLMTSVGVASARGVRPIARQSHDYVLTWLEKVTLAEKQ